MRAARRNKTITIQRRVETEDEFGEQIITWTDLKTVRASIKPLTGKEETAGQQPQGEVSHEIMTLFFPGVTRKDRVLFGTRLFDIVTPINMFERSRDLKLLCIEIS